MKPLSIPKRFLSTGFEPVEHVNVGKKHEKSVAAVKVPAFKEGPELDTSAFNVSQQGLQLSTSLAKTSVKGGSGSVGVDHHRFKATPVGARFDPLYLSTLFKLGRLSLAGEFSPFGLGPLGLGPYGKLTGSGKLKSGGELALSTGYPFFNYIPPPDPNATPEDISKVKALPSTEPPKESELTPFPPTPRRRLPVEDPEVEQLRVLLEDHPDFDPLTRD